MPGPVEGYPAGRGSGGRREVRPERSRFASDLETRILGIRGQSMMPKQVHVPALPRDRSRTGSSSSLTTLIRITVGEGYIMEPFFHSGR